MNKNLFKTYLIYFIVLSLFVGVRIASGLGAFSFIEDAMTRSNVATIVIQVIVMFIVPFCLILWLFRKKPKQVFQDAHFNKISGKSVLICFAIGILLFILNLAVSSVFNGIIQMFGYQPSSGGSGYTYDTFGKFILGVIFVAVLPGICEEFLHRGVLMRNIGRETNYNTAIIISSICFGLMHLNIEQFFYATILGLIIGFVGAMSDSIFPCMILHFTNNFLSVYFTYAQNAGLPGGDFYKRINTLYSSNSPIFTFIFSITILLLVVVGIIYLMFVLFKDTRLKKIYNSLSEVQKEVSGENLGEQSQQKLETDFNTFILPHLTKSKDTMQVFLPPAKTKKRQTLSTNIFLICTLFMGFLITIFTFMWGLV
ncbi:MAG: CPBP family intramembrane metalloprotease [Clostridiales bacterium]|nr:CPBP family intramembrane metalloprotease [Candidatus Apopatousia equi]